MTRNRRTNLLLEKNHVNPAHTCDQFNTVYSYLLSWLLLGENAGFRCSNVCQHPYPWIRCSVNGPDSPRSSGDRGEEALNCSSLENKLPEINAKKVPCTLKADRSQSFFNTLFCQNLSKDNFPLIKDKTFLSLKKSTYALPLLFYVLLWQRTGRGLLGKTGKWM